MMSSLNGRPMMTNPLSSTSSLSTRTPQIRSVSDASTQDDRIHPFEMMLGTLMSPSNPWNPIFSNIVRGAQAVEELASGSAHEHCNVSSQITTETARQGTSSIAALLLPTRLEQGQDASSRDFGQVFSTNQLPVSDLPYPKLYTEGVHKEDAILNTTTQILGASFSLHPTGPHPSHGWDMPYPTHLNRKPTNLHGTTQNYSNLTAGSTELTEDSKCSSLMAGTSPESYLTQPGPNFPFYAAADNTHENANSSALHSSILQDPLAYFTGGVLRQGLAAEGNVSDVQSYVDGAAQHAGSLGPNSLNFFSVGNPLFPNVNPEPNHPSQGWAMPNQVVPNRGAASTGSQDTVSYSSLIPGRVGVAGAWTSPSRVVEVSPKSSIPQMEPGFLFNIPSPKSHENTAAFGGVVHHNISTANGTPNRQSHLDGAAQFADQLGPSSARTLRIIAEVKDGNHSTNRSSKNLTCKNCKQSFSRRDHLKEHQRVHTGERPYVCDFGPLCTRTFRWRSGWAKHIKSHLRIGHKLPTGSKYLASIEKRSERGEEQGESKKRKRVEGISSSLKTSIASKKTRHRLQESTN